MIHRFSQCAALVGVTLLSASARAQEPATPPAPATEAEPAPAAPDENEDPNLQPAREAFRLGSTLARQGQWQDALAAYERSAELRAHAVTTYNIGYVERALGHLTRARQFFTRALEAGPSSGLDPLPENLQGMARSYLSEIDHKIARVSVTLADPKIAVSVDGRPLEVLSTGERPLLSAGIAAPGRPVTPPTPAFDLLVDPGRHVILLSLAGKGDRLLNQDFEAGSAASLSLAVESEPPPAPAPAPIAPAQMESSEPANLRPWMWTAFGVGAAGVVTGSVFGILAIKQESKLSGLCPVKPNCLHSDEMDRLDDYALVSTIGFGVGIVGLGVGTGLWFVDRGKEKATPALRETPRVDITRNGILISGRF